MSSLKQFDRILRSFARVKCSACSSTSSRQFSASYGKLARLVSPRTIVRQRILDNAKTGGVAHQPRAQQNTLEHPNKSTTPNEIHSTRLATSSDSIHHNRQQEPQILDTFSKPELGSSIAPVVPKHAKLSYFVSRTPSAELPVYQDRKRGGNYLITFVKKISGDIDSLKEDIRINLKLSEELVWINRRTRHVVMKGHHKTSLVEFLKAKDF